MTEMGLFTTCIPVIDTDDTSNVSDSIASIYLCNRMQIDTYHIVMLVEEPKSIKGEVGVGIDGTTETQANCGVSTKSLTGRGETGQVTVVSI